MAKAKDITGRKFNRLLVLSREPNRGTHSMWKCKCDCGNITTVSGTALKSGKTKSCGCFAREESSKRNRTHGGYGTRLYSIWIGMRRRCRNIKSNDYARYGGNGIDICNEWNNSFEVFRDWSMKNGYDDNLTLDRIDNNGNYEPSNCRWATAETQCNNRTSNRKIEYNGKIHTIAEWAKITGLDRKLIRDRLENGWSIKDSLTIPKIKQKGVHHGKL